MNIPFFKGWQQQELPEEVRKFHEELIAFAKTLPPPTGEPWIDLVQRIIPFQRKYRELLRKYPKVRELVERLWELYPPVFPEGGLGSSSKKGEWWLPYAEFDPRWVAVDRRAWQLGLAKLRKYPLSNKLKQDVYKGMIAMLLCTDSWLGYSYRPAVGYWIAIARLVIKDREIAEFFAELFGVKLHFRTPYWHCVASGLKVLTVCRMVKPWFLGRKKGIADFIISRGYHIPMQVAEEFMRSFPTTRRTRFLIPVEEEGGGKVKWRVEEMILDPPFE